MQKNFGLSHPQKRIFYTEQLYPHTAFANIVFLFWFENKMDLTLLGKAVNGIVNCNDSLRLQLSEELDEESGVQQYFTAASEFDLEVVGMNSREECRSWALLQAEIPFVLYDLPLFNFTLIKLPANKSGLFVKIHHLIADGWTVKWLVQEILRIYDLLAQGEILLTNEVSSYTEYIERERAYMLSGEAKQDCEYWLEKYATLPEPTYLHSSKRQPETIRSNRVNLRIPPSTKKIMNKSCRQHRTTMFRMLLAVVIIYVYRVTGRTDLAIGMPYHGRQNKREKEMAGMFASTLPLHFVFSEEMNFSDLLKLVNKEVSEAIVHSRYPYDQLVADLKEIYGEVPDLLGLNISDISGNDAEGVQCQSIETGYDPSPLNFYISTSNEAGEQVLDIFSVYQQELFAQDEVRQLLLRLCALIENSLAQPEKKLYELRLMPAAEEQLVLETFNDTKRDYELNTTIHELFAEQAAKTPDKAALVYKGQQLTYREVNEKANQLACLLIAKGVQPDSIVGVLVERSLIMLILPLAVLKAGGAYLPIDPAYPDERIAYMLQDSKTAIVLSQSALREKSAGFAGEWLDVEDPSLYTGSADNPPSCATAHNLVYVIYTSGSTGKPKGVMIEHQALLNLCAWQNDYHEVTAADNTALYSGFGFDACIWEFMPFLTKGATVHIIPEEIRLSPLQVNEYFAANKISIADLPTQFAEQFMEMNEHNLLRRLITGGDKLKTYRLDRCKLINEYGPTEYTISATAFVVEGTYENIPIGKPLANTQIYILDKYFNPQPVGVPGELFIAGAQLARGYLHRPELTAEKFVSNPFGQGALMYRSGDLARWLPDGNIEFLGRVDYQVKIRGFRIELGEIEQQIIRYEGVRDVAVIAREDKDGNNYLCAYLVTDDQVQPAALKSFLAANLPEYMIPPYLVEMSALPLTANGKVDRRVLPEPELKEKTAVSYAAPRNEMEEKMVGIWQAVLGLTTIGIDDNFFALGGHSLKAGILQAKIQKKYSVLLTLAEIFKRPTIRELSALISAEASCEAKELLKVGKNDFYPASVAQRAMYVLNQSEGIGASYHVGIAYYLNGPLAIARLEAAINVLIARHEALRTYFTLADGKIVQKIADVLRIKLAYKQADIAEIKNEEYIKSMLAKINMGADIDLAVTPLLRAGLLGFSPAKHLLFIEVHHIIFDGISLELFFQELALAYDSKKLPALSFQYKDYSAWHNDFLCSPAANKQENFWLQSLQGELPVLQLPTDYVRPAQQNFAGDRLHKYLGESLTNDLKKLADGSNVSLFMVLLTAYYALLSRYTGQEDIIVGTPAAGRTNEDTANIIGMFVNTLPLRAKPAGKKTFACLLLEIRELVLNALDSQDYPFSLLVDKLGVQRDISRNPLFATVFVLQNINTAAFETAELRGEVYPLASSNAQVDLTVEAEELDDNIAVVFEYAVKLFKRETIDRFAEHYLAVLRAVCKNSQVEIAHINLLSPREEKQLLLDFNQTARQYPSDKTVQQLFEEVAAAYPDKVALVYKDTHYTYSELNARSNCLAQKLRRKGVGPDKIVALLVERSVHIMVGALAVMKAGGAYLPIDQAYPEERISYMLADSGAVILLSQQHLSGKAQAYQGECLDLANEELYAGMAQAENLLPVNTSHDLAYVIYTSGSTGKPKGVMVEHSSLVNLCLWHNNYHGVGSADHGAAYSGFGFDASLWEMFPFITCGAELHILPDEIRMSPEELNLYFEANGISITNLPTQLCEQFMELTDNHSLQTLVTGGDKLRNFRKQKYRLVNEYGPTEYTISATAFLVDRPYDNIPVGKPLANTWLYVLDRYEQLQPLGVAGELCIAGAQLARGYLHRAELTAEKFVVNPYASCEENARMYKTGDLVRWLPDGNIEFLGRIDQQVKIRGYRIEIGEIEQQLVKHPAVKDAVVIDRNDAQGSKYLCAYVVAENELQFAELKTFIGQELPDYMVPAYFLRIEQIPLTANGKIDKQALPVPAMRTGDAGEYLPPRNEVEACLAAVWQSVLGCAKVGIKDNFFHLGGDSIKAIQVISRLRQQQIKLEMKQLFQYPCISELSHEVVHSGKVEDQSAVQGSTALTPIQKWFFASDFAVPYHWNQSVLLYAANGFEEELTAQVLRKIVEHHDGLRLLYRLEAGEVCQYNRSSEEGELFVLHVREADAAADARQVAVEEAEKLQKSMNLCTGPLLQAALVRQNSAAYLAIVVHHLVVDGVSWKIILEDLATAYTQAAKGETIHLPAKSNSYQSWAKSLQEYAHSRVLLREIAYWQTVEQAEVKKLPVDYPQASVSTLRAEAVSEFSLAKNATAKLLKESNKAYYTEIDDILLAGLGLAVRQWAGVSKVAVTLEGHGREEILKDIDISRTVGWFTSTYPVVVNVGEGDDFGYVLKSVKEDIRRIPNKGVGSDIIRHLTPAAAKEKMVYKLKPEIEFNYLGQMDDKEADNGVFSLVATAAGQDISIDNVRDFRLVISGMVMADCLQISLTYSQLDYEATTIERLLAYYKNYLLAIIEHCGQKAESEKTPSDLGDPTLNFAELQKLRQIYGQNIQAVYPLSPMQEGMLFLSLLNKTSGMYFEQSVYEVRGEIDIKHFEQHFNHLIQKHDILRTAFVHEWVVRQVVLTERPASLHYEDISSYEQEERQQYIDKYQSEDRSRLFDLQTGTLIRLAVFKTAAQVYSMVLGFHHIIMDGWCMGIICKELFADYRLNTVVLPAQQVPPPYSRYIEWLLKQDKEEAREYWHKYLADCEMHTSLPQEKAVHGSSEYQPQDLMLSLERKLTCRLQEIARENQVTLHIILQAVWGLLLQRYNNRHDVVFGTVVSGRTPEVKGIEEMVGLFINTIPVRVQCEKDMTFAELVQKLQLASLASEQYSYLPLAEIQRESTLQEGLVGHLLAFENLQETEVTQESGLQVKEVGGFDQTNYSFGLVLVPGEELGIRFSYNGQVFTRESIEEMAGQLLTVVAEIAAEPLAMVHSINILPAKQKQQILESFNKTKMAVPAAQTVHELFEDMVRKYPNKIALVYKEQIYTYELLNTKANRLARLLRGKNVGKDCSVAIMVNRGPEIIFASLAVMKAGGAYVPIDPAYPQERIEYMLADSGATVLLTQKELAEKAGSYQGEHLDLTDEVFYEQSIDGSNLETVSNGNNLVYVIYTSGSTGKPKGVMIEHHSLLNLCVWHQQYHQVNADDKGATYSGFGFDASVWEMYPFLTCGAALHIIPDELRLSPLELNRYFTEHGITITNLPTQFCEQFMAMTENKSLRTLVTGGDKLKYCRSQQYRLVNEYGPTEYTISATAFLVDKEYDNIPIGKPLGNTWLYVLDCAQQLQPVGVPGELCIAGAQLARGYKNREDLTREHFVPNPFAVGSENARMYKTGDLVRWLPDGNIEFMGRLDQQVKIRGYRIELGEIEQQLRKHEQIKDCVVSSLQDSSGGSYLCAYFVSEEELTSKELKAYLAKTLPEYMIPLHFLAIAQIPLTANGKVDAKSLPVPGISADGGGKEYIAPRTDIEAKVAQIWQEVLNVDRVGMADDFFALGGKSVQVTLLNAKLQKAFAVTIPYEEIFSKTTVAELSSMIAGKSNSSRQEITALPPQEYYPLTVKQKRVFVMEQMESIGTPYCLSSAFLLTGELDREKLSMALEKFVASHSSLRTAIAVCKGDALQQVYPQVHVKKVLRQVQEDEVKSIVEQFVRKFALGKPPLFRMELLEVNSKRHILLFAVHQLIFDGISLEIFAEELLSIYSGKELPEPNLQYGDFALWEKGSLQSAGIKEHENYWLAAFAGELPLLALPCDYPRPASRSYEGAVVTFKIDSKLVGKLRSLAEQQQATMFMLLLGAYNVLLHKYTGQDDIIVGTPTSGRTHADLADVVGLFASNLPYRLYPAAEKSFQQLLAEVKNVSLAVLDHQEFPFEELLERLNIRRDPSRNPLFDVMFSFNSKDISLPTDEKTGLSISNYEIEGKVAQVDLTLDINEENEELSVAFEYSTKLFRPETINCMGTHFINILNIIGENSQILLQDIAMLTAKEKQMLLHGFNDKRKFHSSYRTVQTLFTEAAKKFADKPALVYQDKIYTYHELDCKTNQLARLLRAKGLKREERVAIMVNRSPEMVIGILAVIKAGACYVCLEPDYAAERIAYILADSEAEFLLSQQCLRLNAGQFGGEWLDLAEESLYAGDDSGLDDINSPEDLLQVVYSFSALEDLQRAVATPGVMLEHHNLVNLCQWQHSYGLTAADKGAVCGKFGSIISVREILPLLTCGAAVHIVPAEIYALPLALNMYFNEQQITVATLPALLCEQFIELVDNKSLRLLFSSGVKLQNYQQQNYQLINCYGSVESINSAAGLAAAQADGNTIGKSADNTWLYVLDHHKHLQPLGVAGELYIAGEQVARGYLNKSELTAEKFIVNPFATSQQNSRFYKTGELVRWLPNGKLEFLGRLDRQVKISGYQIDLAEIEQRLLRQPQIAVAAVNAMSEPDGERSLVAYLVMKEAGIALAEFKKYLLQYFPAYMVPSYYLEVNELPFAANGEIDWKALPQPEYKTATAKSKETCQVAGNQTEEKIIAVWKEILGLDNIDVQDNFFQLGGNSIKAITVIAKLQPYFEITINQIFEHQTVADLAAHCLPKQNQLQVKLAELKEQLQQEDNKEKEDACEKIWAEKKAVYQQRNAKYQKLDIGVGKNYASILLTGATGYLGVHLLRELLVTTKSNLYLPVRAGSEEASHLRLQEKMRYYFGEAFATQALDSGRLIVLKSSLQEGRLGLTAEKYEEMVKNIDCIIHAAANVRHYGHYEEFWQSNVQVTLNLLEFAKQGTRKDFHHISTISVSEGNIPGCEAAVFSEYEADIGQESGNYYLKTKLAAEKAVIAAREEGLNTNIYRIGNIVFQSDTGTYQENIEDNAFYLQLRAFVNLGVIPAGFVTEFSFVDQLAKAVVCLLACPALYQETYHLYNSHTLYLDEILADSALGLQVKSLPYDQFIDYLSANYDKPNFRKHIEQIMLHFGWMDAEDKGEGDIAIAETELLVLSDKTNMILQQLGFKWGELVPAAMKKMLARALQERIEFLQQIPVFADLSMSEAAKVAGQATMRLYQDNTSVLWEGDVNENFYLIMDGFIEISRKSLGGWLGTLRVAGRNEFIAEESLIGEKAAAVTAEAIMGDVVLLVIPAQILTDMLQTCPKLAFGLVKAMNSRIRNLEKFIISMG